MQRSIVLMLRENPALFEPNLYFVGTHDLEIKLEKKIKKTLNDGLKLKTFNKRRRFFICHQRKRKNLESN